MKLVKHAASLFLALTLAVPSAAQMTGHEGMATSASPRAPCPASPPPLPPELAGWSAAVPTTAAGTPRELALAMLEPGRGARATLVPVTRIAFPLAPSHTPAAGTYGGLFAFAVTQAGTYRIALGGAAWIDVVKDGRPVTSSAHGHGPDCSPVRKTVDFPLAPGRYLLQVSGSTSLALALMVAPVAG